MKKTKQWYYKAYLIAYIVGIVLCTVPTFICALIKLPVIASKDTTSTLSGVFAVGLIVGIMPLYKALVSLLKSPSTAILCWILWGFLMLLTSMQTETVLGLRDVLLWAAVGNTLGVIAFRLSKSWKELWQHCGEVTVNNG